MKIDDTSQTNAIANPWDAPSGTEGKVVKGILAVVFFTLVFLWLLLIIGSFLFFPTFKGYC